jgi:hypothetical protein
MQGQVSGGNSSGTQSKLGAYNNLPQYNSNHNAMGYTQQNQPSR